MWTSSVAGDTPPRAGALSPVAAANPKSPGVVEPNVLSVELQEVAVARGATHYENPTPALQRYGYLNNGPSVPLPTVPTSEASKTEPDNNTYLVFPNDPNRADPAYDYGTHFRGATFRFPLSVAPVAPSARGSERQPQHEESRQHQEAEQRQGLRDGLEQILEKPPRLGQHAGARPRHIRHC